MGIREFSDGFDVLLNSSANQLGFGNDTTKVNLAFDEYEKSVFLTNAQKALVIALYNGKNPYGDSFEHTEELRRYLSPLVLDSKLDPITTLSGAPLGVSSTSKFFTLPENLWFITYEAAMVNDHECGEISMDVLPVTQDEYHKIKRNPFRGANSRRALRLDLADGVIEIICKYNVTKYYIRYLKKLHPIILEDMPDGVSIDGFTTAMRCELHEGLHQQILERAVRLALQSKSINSNSKE